MRENKITIATKFMPLVDIINCKFELTPKNHYHSTPEQQNIQFILVIPRIRYFNILSK